MPIQLTQVIVIAKYLRCEEKKRKISPEKEDERQFEDLSEVVWRSGCHCQLSLRVKYIVLLFLDFTLGCVHVDVDSPFKQDVALTGV